MPSSKPSTRNPSPTTIPQLAIDDQALKTGGDISCTLDEQPDEK